MDNTDSERYEARLRIRRKLRNRIVSTLVVLGAISLAGTVFDVSFWLTLIVAVLFSLVAYLYWITPYQTEWKEWVSGRTETDES